MPRFPQCTRFPHGISNLANLTCSNWRSILKVLPVVVVGLFEPQFPRVDKAVQKVPWPHPQLASSTHRLAFFACSRCARTTNTTPC